MRIAGQRPIRDRYSGSPLRPAKALQVIVLNIIQAFFEGNPGDEPNRTIWNKDDAITQMYIGAQTAIDKDKVGLKPTVVVKRGIHTFKNKGGINQMEFEDMRDSSKIFNDLIGGAINIQCYDDLDSGAEDLAMDIFELFGYIKSVAKEFGIFGIDNLAIGEEVVIIKDSRPKFSMVPISFNGVVQTRWKVTPKAQELAGYDYIQ